MLRISDKFGNFIENKYTDAINIGFGILYFGIGTWILVTKSLIGLALIILGIYMSIFYTFMFKKRK